MDFLNTLLGLHEQRLDALQMCVRAVLVFFIGLLYVRIAGIRTFGKATTFDQITSLVMGTLLGNAIFAGSYPLFPILLASLVIMLLHRAIAWITFINHNLGKIIKGKTLLIVKDGVLQEDVMKKLLMSSNDVHESLRLKEGTNDLEEIAEAYVERSGKLSFQKKSAHKMMRQNK